VTITRRGLIGVAASVLIVGAAIATFQPTSDIGYVEIKTVPVAQATRTVLHFDSTKLAPIKNGSAILRHAIGTLKLQADGVPGSLAPLCDIVVKRNRITTVTISILERPPRCRCRYGDADAAHACVS
jgi:hypothetical protein